MLWNSVLVAAISIIAFISLQNNFFGVFQHGVSGEPLPKQSYHQQSGPAVSDGDEILDRDRRSPEAQPEPVRRVRSSRSFRYRFRARVVRYRRNSRVGGTQNSVRNHMSSKTLLAIIFGTLSGTLVLTAVVAYFCSK